MRERDLTERQTDEIMIIGMPPPLLLYTHLIHSPTSSYSLFFFLYCDRAFFSYNYYCNKLLLNFYSYSGISKTIWKLSSIPLPCAPPFIKRISAHLGPQSSNKSIVGYRHKGALVLSLFPNSDARQPQIWEYGEYTNRTKILLYYCMYSFIKDILVNVSRDKHWLMSCHSECRTPLYNTFRIMLQIKFTCMTSRAGVTINE